MQSSETCSQANRAVKRSELATPQNPLIRYAQLFPLRSAFRKTTRLKTVFSESPGQELHAALLAALTSIATNPPNALRSKPLRSHKELWGECISGALYWNDFIGLAKKVGFLDPRLVSSSPISIANSELEGLVGNIKFYSATYRLFKLPALETHCEDYGQAVIYNGGMLRSENSFMLDDHHTIEKGKVFGVCGNTWRMLANTRFQQYFTFLGNFDIHYGIYDGCGTTIPFESGEGGGGGGGACC